MKQTNAVHGDVDPGTLFTREICDLTEPRDGGDALLAASATFARSMQRCGIPAERMLVELKRHLRDCPLVARGTPRSRELARRAISHAIESYFTQPLS